MGQILVRILAGLVSVATAFAMNIAAPQQTSVPTRDVLLRTETQKTSATRATKSPRAAAQAQPRAAAKAQPRANQSARKPIIQPLPSGTVRQTALQENEYGAHWGEIDGAPAFFTADNKIFAKHAEGVIDVSEHQHEIDWEAVKASGVNGAIIRISYGWDNGYDKQALRNINECKRLGIPFGIYTYSYAEKAEDGAAEGADIVKLLKGAGVNPDDLSYPVYYDLEPWVWTGHEHPTSPYVYQDIVASWWNQLSSAGYNKLGVYSYTNYLNGPLNSKYIHDRTSWVASYGSNVGFSISTPIRGWQYTSSGSVNGISGSVDLNAFGMTDGSKMNFAYSTSSNGDDSDGGTNGDANSVDVRELPSVEVPNGYYFINAMLKNTSSIDMPGASNANETPIQLYQWNNSAAQQFMFERQGDGSYVIRNAHSGKVLDVQYAKPKNGAVVWQYDANGSKAQRWVLRNSGSGYYVQSALGNWVLDISGANSSNGARITLYRPNGTEAQLFMPASAELAAKNNVTIKSAANNNVAIDISGANLGNFAPVQVSQFNADAKSQHFNLKQVGNGLYVIVNKNSHKAIDVPSSKNDNGTKIRQYAAHKGNGQRWMLWKYSDGTYAIVSLVAGRAIDIPNGNAANGQLLQLYAPNHSASQRWVIE